MSKVHLIKGKDKFGREKNCYYSDSFIGEDTLLMSNMCEYCDKFAKEEFGYTGPFNKKLFIETFFNSDCRHYMEDGDPKLLCQSSAETFENYVRVDLNSDCSVFNNGTDDTNDYAEYQLYWVGTLYAYMHYKTKLATRELVKIYPVSEAIRFYYCGHTMDIDSAWQRIKVLFDENRPFTGWGKEEA